MSAMAAVLQAVETNKVYMCTPMHLWMRTCQRLHAYASADFCERARRKYEVARVRQRARANEGRQAHVQVFVCKIVRWSSHVRMCIVSSHDGQQHRDASRKITIKTMAGVEASPGTRC